MDLGSLIESREAHVAVVGQGYVGLPLAMAATAAGYQVTGLDVSSARVEALHNGRSPIPDVDDATVAAALDAGYRAATNPETIAGFDVALIAVPTPLRDGQPDLSYVHAAARTVAAGLTCGALVVLESTTYPGTTEEVLRPALEHDSDLTAERDFWLGYSPERIDPGNPHHDLVSTPKLVAGIGPRSGVLAEAFYGTIVDKVVSVGSVAAAELAKLIENTFRHVNVALVNELAMLARDLDIDIWDALDAAATKPFGFMRFTPGPGVGGHCLPIDPSYLSWRVKRRLGHTFRFVELANDVNDHMPDYVATRAMVMLNRYGLAMRGTRVLVLGLAYKAGTDDWRESPALAVVDRLVGLGADVIACEPHVPHGATPPVPLVPFTPDQLAAADLVVLAVDHETFDPGHIARHARLVLDTKGAMRHLRFNGEVL